VPPVLVPCLSCIVATYLYDAWLNSEKVEAGITTAEPSPQLR
jgi:hypothetical protein